jgi:hypothetical protein
VAVDSDDPVAPARVVGALASPTTMRWIAALEDSGDLRARASGLLLEGLISDGITAQPMSETNRDELVQLASGSSDAAVYAMALWACRTTTEGADPACGRLSLERWAAMDPDNAMPWLALATKARARGDAAAESVAFRHAAQTHRSDGYSDYLLRSAESAIPADATALVRSFLFIEVNGVEAAMLFPYNILSTHCSDAALADDRVRTECGALAEVLVSHGETLIEPGIGANLGARLGWPPERVAALSMHHKALLQAETLAAPAGNDDLWTCRSVALLNDWMHRRGQLGNAGAAEEVLRSSGETDEAMAAKWDQAMDKMRRTASP